MLREDVDSDSHGVKVLTLHSAKGLGFPIVAVSLVTQAGLHVSNPNEQLELFNHQKRLNYMAFTRSLHALFVTLPLRHRVDRFAGVRPTLWHAGWPRG